MTEQSDVADIVDDKPFPVQFRISGEQAKTAHRLADYLFKQGAIKTNSINALMRACAFTQINLYLQMEAKELAFQERQLQLERERIELEKRGVVKYQDVNKNHIPNVGGY